MHGMEFTGCLCGDFCRQAGDRLPSTEKQETDTHWRARGGIGQFNWRMVFDVHLPQARIMQ